MGATGLRGRISVPVCQFSRPYRGNTTVSFTPRRHTEPISLVHQGRPGDPRWAPAVGPGTPEDLTRSPSSVEVAIIFGGIGDERIAELVASCIPNADDVDYDELFTRFYPVLHRYSFRLTGDVDEADDVAQEAFVRLIRGSVTGKAPALRSWLFRTALNLVRDRSRVRTNRERLLESNPDAAVTQTEPARPDRNAIQSEDVRRVRRTLESLPERDRVILLMREEGFKYHEIAREVGVAAGSVGTLLARAQERFAKAYRDERSESDASDDR